MKKALSFLLSLVLLAGCSSGSSEKTVKVSDVADLIAAQDTLVPGPDFSWDLDEETFLEQVHGADTMIPGSEQFDSLRYSYNGAIDAATYTPPVRYQLKGIKTDATCAYAFCGDGLYMSGYQWIFDGSEADAQEGIETILSQLNEISFLSPVSGETPTAEMFQQNASFQWTPKDAPEQSVTLTVSRIRTNTSILLTVKAYELIPSEFISTLNRDWHGGTYVEDKVVHILALPEYYDQLVEQVQQYDPSGAIVVDDPGDNQVYTYPQLQQAMQRLWDQMPSLQIVHISVFVHPRSNPSNGLSVVVDPSVSLTEEYKQKVIQCAQIDGLEFSQGTE